MKTLAIADIFNGKLVEGDNVSVQGWVRTRRDSKAGFSFVNVHDGSSLDPIQVVVDKSIANYQTEVLKITTGCSIKVQGELVASPGKGQAFEIKATEVTVVGWVDDPETYPMQPKRHSVEFLREVAHLRPRTNLISAVTRVRHQVAQAIHSYFHQHGFYWINTPLITASDCEGAGELFRVSTLDMANLPRTEQGGVDFSQDFFGRETFLTVSGQLNVEAYCLAMSKVYTFGPTFRSENSNTARHLAEFWMVEPEVAFADLQDIAELAEDLLKHVFKTVLSESSEDMAFFEKRVNDQCIKRLDHIINANFAQISYSDAVELLINCKQKFEYPVTWGTDLQTEHERFLAEQHFKCPVIVTDYPKDIKGFYMRINDDEKTVAAMDILAPGIGEIIGGSQREERLDVLDKRGAELEMDMDHYGWYRDLRRYGTVPHSGFGVGFERLVLYITGLANIRDVIPFPRTPNNASF